MVEEREKLSEMATPSSSASNKLQSLVKVLYRCTISASNLRREPFYCGSNLPSKYLNYGQYSSGHIHEGLKSIPPNSGIASKAMADMVKESMDKVQPSVPPPRKSIFPTWVNWLFGSVLAILLPFWKLKWGSLLLLEEKVEEVVEEVEIVAEVVDKVATAAEKVSENVADKLPDNSKLKEAALAAEHISSVAVTDAELAENFIHKIEDIKHDLTDLGTIVEPVIDKIIPNPKEHVGN